MLKSKQVLTLSIGTAVIALSVPHIALAADSSTYVGLHAGQNFLKDTTAKVDFGGGIAFDGTAELDSGQEVGVVIGQRFGGWRLEGEYQHGQFKIASVQLAGSQVASGAKGQYDTLMLNGYRAINFTSRTALFVGAGVGWGRMVFPKVNFDATCDCFPRAAKGGFVYQFRGGLQQSIGSNAQIFAQYNRLFMPAVASSNVPSVAYPKRNFGVASLGLLVHFGGSRSENADAVSPATPALAADQVPLNNADGGSSVNQVDAPSAALHAEPAAPVAAEALPGPGPFIILFDLNKADISAESRETLNKALAASKSLEGATFELIGATDTSGPSNYNRALSERRVKAAADYLTSQGVSGQALRVKAVGENELNVPTADNQVEGQNRRVEIRVIVSK